MSSQLVDSLMKNVDYNLLLCKICNETINSSFSFFSVLASISKPQISTEVIAK